MRRTRPSEPNPAKFTRESLGREFGPDRELLRKDGRRARRLTDGFPEWKAAGLPVRPRPSREEAEHVVGALSLVHRRLPAWVVIVGQRAALLSARWRVTSTARKTHPSRLASAFVPSCSSGSWWTG